MVLFAFACLLTCENAILLALFSSLSPSLPSLGKYSTDWVQCDGAFGGGCSQGCRKPPSPVPDGCLAPPTF